MSCSDLSLLLQIGQPISFARQPIAERDGQLPFRTHPASQRTYQLGNIRTSLPQPLLGHSIIVIG
jgi:hypothetical protein